MKKLFKFGIVLASIFTISAGLASPKDDLKERLQSSRSGQDRIEVIVGKLAPQRYKVVVGRRSGKRRHGDARIRAVAV